MPTILDNRLSDTLVPLSFLKVMLSVAAVVTDSLVLVEPINSHRPPKDLTLTAKVHLSVVIFATLDARGKSLLSPQIASLFAGFMLLTKYGCEASVACEHLCCW